MKQELALETRGLVKSFKAKRAVDGVDFAVCAGEITGFLGPNGAGKTTVLNIASGLLAPDAGEVVLLGVPNGFRDPRIRKRVGCLQEKPRIYPNMTARQYLRLFADLYAVARPASRIEETLELVSLTFAADQPLAYLSRGMQQRICLARTLVHYPEFLILDEPTLGLDPAGVSDMRQIFRELRRGGVTLLFSSHQLDEMERVCDNIVFLHGGRVLASGRKDEILPEYGDINFLEVELLELAAPQIRRISSLEIVRRVDEHKPHILSIELDMPEAVQIRQRRGAIARALTACGLTVLSVSQPQPSLEQLFHALSSEGSGDSGSQEAEMRGGNST